MSNIEVLDFLIEEGATNILEAAKKASFTNYIVEHLLEKGLVNPDDLVSTIV